MPGQCRTLTMLADLLAQLTGTPGWEMLAVPAVFSVAFWLRIEHRLTRIETRFDDLPCKDPKTKRKDCDENT